MPFSPFPMARPRVPATEVRVEEIGVNPLDRRRVDVAVDLTPSQEPVTVEMVIVGPQDDELCSAVVVESEEWMLDKILHLRQDAKPGPHTLHVGVFAHGQLVTHAAKTFSFLKMESGEPG